MGRRVIDIFLSSTAVDLADYRKAVHERLMRTGLKTAYEASKWQLR